jgi:GAF domain-containing protein
MDLYTIIKFCQALAGEVDLTKLMRQLMQFVMENAGAEKACLLLQEDNGLVLRARSDLKEVVCAVLLEETDSLACNVVDFVHRTRESLVLHDAAAEGMFTRDQYIKKHGVKSVLCLPVINQSRLIGILYLENNLSSRAFTPDGIEILSLLSTQIAVSLENARLFTRLKESHDQIARWNQILEQRVRTHPGLGTGQSGTVSVGRPL